MYLLVIRCCVIPWVLLGSKFQMDYWLNGGPCKVDSERIWGELCKKKRGTVLLDTTFSLQSSDFGRGNGTPFYSLKKGQWYMRHTTHFLCLNFFKRLVSAAQSSEILSYSCHHALGVRRWRSFCRSSNPIPVRRSVGRRDRDWLFWHHRNTFDMGTLGLWQSITRQGYLAHPRTKMCLFPNCCIILKPDQTLGVLSIFVTTKSTALG